MENCRHGIHIGNGDGIVPQSKLTAHDRPDGIQIVFNTVVNCRDSVMMLDRRNGLGATNITFANNLITGTNQLIAIDGRITHSVWRGNILWGNTNHLGEFASGFEVIDPQLKADARGEYHLPPGSPAIGREVAKAAAEQLVPVTLELGGKCPAIVAPDSIDAESIKQLLGTKAVKNGQMCISVDYCLVPRERVAEFADLAAAYARESMPGYCSSESCTGIISARHLERIEKLLGEARASGAEVRPLEDAGEADPDARQLPMSLVIDPPEELGLMREEIFGPVLPVKAYDSIDEAVAYVNAGERPLALYVFSKDEQLAEDVLRRTTSGGACVNSAAVHGALPSLPFGGSGQSGSGRHHGLEGFREFSNMRGVLVRGDGDMIEAFAPPYGPEAQAVADAAFGAAAGGGEG